MSPISKLYKFNGGIRLEGHKRVSCTTPISQLQTPSRLVIALDQHIGSPAQPMLNVGDSVLKGQIIARAKGNISATVHASCSGIITAIENRAVPHPSGLSDLCVEIENDGKDQCINFDAIGLNYKQLGIDQLLENIRNSGIVGLGGAGFPSAVKIIGGRSKNKLTLIVNAAECEPWISCDQILVQERSDQILIGIEILMHLTQADNCIIGFEDNIPIAVKAFNDALENHSINIAVRIFPAIYPTGGERQLIKLLTNHEVPAGGIPPDIGMLVFNVASIWAIYDFVINGKPLISRVVTITGDGVAQPQNIEAPIGTPISHLIQHAGGYSGNTKQLTMGGPMMGFSLQSDTLHLVKASNCILVQTQATITLKPQQLPCIRCSACVDVCPANLLPQQLFWYARAKNLDAMTKFNISSCIECGCCDYVCPSHIPLVHYFRYGKSEIESANAELIKSENARLRFDARNDRLERLKKEKAAKLTAKKVAIAARSKNQKNDQKDAIAQALERAKKRKLERESNSKGNTDEG